MTQNTTDAESNTSELEAVATDVIETFKDAVGIIETADPDDLNYDWASFLDEWDTRTNDDGTQVRVEHEDGAWIRITGDSTRGFDTLVRRPGRNVVPQRALMSTSKVKHTRNDVVNHAASRMLNYSRDGKF